MRFSGSVRVGVRVAVSLMRHLRMWNEVEEGVAEQSASAECQQNLQLGAVLFSVGLNTRSK